MIATRCHPASIGFSSVAGCVGVVRDTDDFGVDAVLGDAESGFWRPWQPACSPP